MGVKNNQSRMRYTVTDECVDWSWMMPSMMRWIGRIAVLVLATATVRFRSTGSMGEGEFPRPTRFPPSPGSLPALGLVALRFIELAHVSRSRQRESTLGSLGCVIAQRTRPVGRKAY
jgi:hypothetical protein